MAELITHKEVLALLHYNPTTGEFTWKKSRGGSLVGSRAGHLDAKIGYWVIRINYRLYLAQRLAIFMMTKKWPPQKTDHRNLKRDDNRFENLRPATHRENQGNQGIRSDNTSGAKGVSWDKSREKWEAYITRDERKHHLGRFDSREDAAAAYWKAAREHFGEFARVS